MTTRDVAHAVAGAVERASAPEVAAAMAGDVVMYGTVGGIDEGRAFRGRDAVIEYLTDVTTTWERLDVAVDAIYVAGDVAVMFFRETAHSTQGDVPLVTETAMLIRVRDGKVVELHGYMDREAALAAAGISTER